MFSYPSLKCTIQFVADSDDQPIPLFKESVLNDTEPSMNHGERSDSSVMNQDDNVFCSF